MSLLTLWQAAEQTCVRIRDTVRVRVRVGNLEVLPKAYWKFPTGHTYGWTGWYGCQLFSVEWIRPPAGTTRTLKFTNKRQVEITVFSTKRQGLRFYITWAVSKSGTLDTQRERIEELEFLLKNFCY